MASYDWLAAELRRYTYKPGYQLLLDRGTMRDWPRLIVKYEAPDSRDPSRRIPIVAQQIIPDLPEDAEFFATWLERALFDIEVHESREWLRRDGTVCNDPHADRWAKIRA